LFGELPKLFGRDFMIGYLLPAAMFIPAALWVAETFNAEPLQGFLRELPKTREQPVLLGATLFVFFLWLLGVTLLALNRVIIRAKEGYGSWNPARLLAFIERWRFRRIQNRLNELNEKYITLLTFDQELDPVSGRLHTRLSRLLAERFPARETDLLPTAFGNTIRAFEVYSDEMYGLDSIPAWPRLLMIMPEGSRTLVEAAKAQMDFWINLWLLSFLLVLEYIVLAIVTNERGSFLALLSIIIAWVASNRARAAAVSWGNTVKAAFDVYLNTLREKLQLQSGLAPAQDREQWSRLSAAMIYRDRRGLPAQQQGSEPKKASDSKDNPAQKSKE
jgi:hypothetical protein